MKKYAYLISSALSVVALVFAIADSAFFINKPKAPKSLLKK